WTRRDVQELRRWAYAWKNATSQAERDKIFMEHGVRWSELWRLPYWDPTRMGVVDTMHCILEGLIHYHCRKVLRIDAVVAKMKDSAGIAFEHDWVDYDARDCPADFLLKNPEAETHHIHRIQNKLVISLCDDDEDEDGSDAEDVPMPDVPDGNEPLGITEDQLFKALHRNNLTPLRWVAFSLGLDLRDAQTKADYCMKLLAWRRTKPRSGDINTFSPKAINLGHIKFIQRVISGTEKPSWVNSVPHNYGESNAGTIKADEWRTLSTLYLPIALVLLWGDRPMDQQSARFMGLLDHTMALFTA
ncbi:hypothetical protein GGX14DRAFT_332746, partial [Mycena pura]